MAKWSDDPNLRPRCAQPWARAGRPQPFTTTSSPEAGRGGRLQHQGGRPNLGPEVATTSGPEAVDLNLGPQGGRPQPRAPRWSTITSGVCVWDMVDDVVFVESWVFVNS